LFGENIFKGINVIEVNGVKYEVVENLGFVHDRNQYAKVVRVDDKEQVVVKDPGCRLWRFAKPHFGILGRPTGQGEAL
jgi:hypothetical protein